MSEITIGPLIVMPEKVIRLDYAHTCHLALCDILRAVCQQTVLAGLLKPEEAFHLQRIARKRDSGTVRAYVERVFALKASRGEHHE